MDAVRGLLLLLGSFHGVEALCDGRKDGAQCYGALGGSVDIRLMDSASDTFSYQWVKDDTTVLYVRKNKLEYGVISGRSSFTTSNGTLWINKLTRDDGGNYTLETFVDGKQQKPRTLRLTIQAPVSSVLLVSECQSQGEMRVSCFSEGGESPHYSWTLDGNTLKDTQLLSGNTDSQIIVLKQKVLGRLVCSVKNEISSKADEEEISSCGFEYFDCTLLNGTYITQWLIPSNETKCITTTTEGKKTDMTVSNTPSANITSSNHTEVYSSEDDLWYIKHLPIMVGILSALMVLLVIGVVVFMAGKKKQNKAKEGAEEQDLTYADVSIVKQQRRQLPPREDMEVEYGQVKFSERPRGAAEPTGHDCVYAKVRKGR